MAKKFRANLYMESAVRLIDRQLQAVFLPNDYLWAGGRYPTKIQPKDLPDWYVHGYLYKRHGYISAKGIVDIVYVPNYFIENHCHKYDTIYVSYHEKIVAKPKDGSFWYEGYDNAMDGVIGEALIKKVKIYSPDINTEEIMRELPLRTRLLLIRCRFLTHIVLSIPISSLSGKPNLRHGRANLPCHGIYDGGRRSLLMYDVRFRK